MATLDLKDVSEFVAAAFALAAAMAWVRAARSPIPFLTLPEPSDPHALNAALESYEGFRKGMIWNHRAALLTGVSALASCLSYFLSK